MTDRAGPAPPAGRSPFRERVLAVVRAVPRGRVVTYGQVALLAGKRHGAREVGWIDTAAPCSGTACAWARTAAWTCAATCGGRTHGPAAASMFGDAPGPSQLGPDRVHAEHMEV